MAADRTPSCAMYPLWLDGPPCGRAPCGAVRTILLTQCHGSIGEATPVPPSHESLSEIERMLLCELDEAELYCALTPLEASRRLRQRIGPLPAARNAIEMMLYDQAARRDNLPMHAWWGLPSPQGAPTSAVICLNDLASIEAELAAATHYDSLLVRCMGDPNADLAAIEWITRQTDQALRIDAGGNWDLPRMHERLARLATYNIEYVEQPLPGHRIEQMAALKSTSPVPLFLRDDVRTCADLPHVARACHGITIRLMACGGPTEALALIRAAHELGLKVALSAGIETSAGLTAAAHLAGAVDSINLARHLSLANDPVEGMIVLEGRLNLPERPGLGLRLKPAHADRLREVTHTRHHSPA